MKSTSFSARVFAYVLVIVAVAAVSPAARAAVDAFIWFEDGSIRGESRDPQHMNWIEVSSFQIDQLRNAAIGSATGGAGAGRVPVHNFSIAKHTDASSAKLFKACATGQHYPRVTISMRKAGGDPGYMQIVLHDVFLSGYQKSGGDRPTESLSLNFTKIEYKNIPMGPPATDKSSAANAALASGAVATSLQPPQITGVSASAPTFGTNATITVASTGACANARVDWGDGTANQFFKLTGASTTLPAHAYGSPGTKTIRVGGPDAAYWTANASQKRPPARQGECLGEAQTQVSLKLALAPAPVVR